MASTWVMGRGVDGRASVREEWCWREPQGTQARRVALVGPSLARLGENFMKVAGYFPRDNAHTYMFIRLSRGLEGNPSSFPSMHPRTGTAGLGVSESLPSTLHPLPG